MTTPELTFYTNPKSRGRIVRWMLEETGAPYATEVLEYGTSMKAAAYLAINPMGKVPALRHGAAVVTECAAICAYLADAFPLAGLAPPPHSAARGTYYRWLFFAAGPLEAAWTNQALGVDVPPERQAMVGYGSFARVLDVLEGAIGAREYLVDDHFSAADVYVGSQLGFGMQFGMIDKRPAFARYCEGLAARPAKQRAEQRDGAMG